MDDADAEHPAGRSITAGNARNHIGEHVESRFVTTERFGLQHAARLAEVLDYVLRYASRFVGAPGVIAGQSAHLIGFGQKRRGRVAIG